MPSRGDLGKEFRKCIVAKPGYKLVCADKSQFQLKILAYLLMAVANNSKFWDKLKSGVDAHTATAQLLFDKHEVSKTERYIGKTINSIY